MMTNIFREI